MRARAKLLSTAPMIARFTVPGRDWPSESVAQQANRQPFDSDSDVRTVPLGAGSRSVRLAYSSWQLEGGHRAAWVTGDHGGHAGNGGPAGNGAACQ